MKFEIEFPAEGFNLIVLKEQIEKEFIVEALKRTNNVKAHAAKLLGIGRTSLLKKMTKLGYSLNPPVSKKQKAVKE